MRSFMTDKEAVLILSEIYNELLKSKKNESAKWKRAHAITKAIDSLNQRIEREEKEDAEWER